jgi:DNA-binding NarL/FixJ family response regulator
MGLVFGTEVAPTENTQLNIRGERSLDLIPRDRQVRILVVEDYEPFRRFVSSMLRQQPSLHIVGEVQDGLQAVRQAEALQPDLILLDIGLPGLNGIEAARKIRDIAPSAKIVFLTQESASDVVEEAFALGAQGYVLKAQAGSELLAALEAVSLGLRFASHGLDGHGPAQHDGPTLSRKSGED